MAHLVGRVRYFLTIRDRQERGEGFSFSIYKGEARKTLENKAFSGSVLETKWRTIEKPKEHDKANGKKKENTYTFSDKGDPKS